MAIAPINIASATGQNWLKEAQESLLAAENAGGMMGTLQNSTKGLGTIKGFLANSQKLASGFALISAGTLDAMRDLVFQQADQAMEKRLTERLEQRLNQSRQQVNYTPPKKLDAIIFFDDGTTIDTVKNIMTRPDGTQIDTTTGKEYIDESAVIRMANGAYIDTKKNVMVLANGTKIDTITGLTISTSA